MSNFIRDLFQTQQPNGNYKWDMTNPAWSVIPWLISISAYISLGVYLAVTAPATFKITDFGIGFGTLFTCGGIGVWAHSKANV